MRRNAVAIAFAILPFLGACDDPAGPSDDYLVFADDPRPGFGLFEGWTYHYTDGGYIEQYIECPKGSLVEKVGASVRDGDAVSVGLSCRGLRSDGSIEPFAQDIGHLEGADVHAQCGIGTYLVSVAISVRDDRVSRIGISCRYRDEGTGLLTGIEWNDNAFRWNTRDLHPFEQAIAVQDLAPAAADAGAAAITGFGFGVADDRVLSVRVEMATLN